MLTSLFVSRVNEQAQFTLIAEHEVSALSQSLATTTEHAVVAEHLWLWLHSLVNSAANVSKTLFPPNASRAARGATLRELLGVDEETSPLRHQERALRNHLEHLDERLDVWWENDTSHNIARRLVGPIGHVVVGINETAVFEQFDPASFVLAFQGDVLALRPLCDEMSRLVAVCTKLNEQPWFNWPKSGGDGELG